MYSQQSCWSLINFVPPSPFLNSLTFVFYFIKVVSLFADICEIFVINTHNIHSNLSQILYFYSLVLS